MSETIRVNFARPLGLFPLPDVVLLPHETLPLHVFETRYRHMIHDCLDSSGQFAIATWTHGRRASHDPSDGPISLRPTVCVGQIVQHAELADGRYNLWLHGVCRARVAEIFEPAANRPYRIARLEPTEPQDAPPSPMSGARARLRRILREPSMSKLNAIEKLREWVDHEGIPTRALIELIAFATVSDTEHKYRLLAEPSVRRRAGMVEHELRHLRDLIARTESQSFEDWPKGLSWN